MDLETQPQTNQSFSETANLDRVIAHDHDGVNSPKLNPKYFLGFPVETSAPTDSPLDGTIRLANISGVYKLYAFINGSWQSQVISSTNDQLIENYTKADSSIAVGDVVSLLEGGSTDFWLIDLGGTEKEVGKQANPNRNAASFIAPISITGFSATVRLKMVGTSTDDVDVILASDSSSKPGTTIETQTIAYTGITGTMSDLSVTFTSAISAGTKYWIYVSKKGSLSLTNYYTSESATTWQFYSSGSTYDGGSWSAENNTPMMLKLTKTITAGLYRALDVPNNLGLLGGVKGIAKVVNSGDVDVVIGGKFSSSGTPFTAGTEYFVSSSTAGGISTSGSCLIGRSVSTSLIDTPIIKPINKRYSPGTCFAMSSTPNTFTIMTGFKPRQIDCIADGSVYVSIGSYSNGAERGIKWKNGAAPSAVGLFNNEDSGGGSGGARDTAITPTKGGISITVASASAGRDLSASFTFIY